MQTVPKDRMPGENATAAAAVGAARHAVVRHAVATAIRTEGIIKLL